MQDLYSTDSTQGMCFRSCRLCGSHPATSARSYIQMRKIPGLNDLDHDAGNGLYGLSEEVRTNHRVERAILLTKSIYLRHEYRVSQVRKLII